MENQVSLIAKSALISLGGITGYLWGEWNALMKILTFMVIADYVTGVLAGFVTGKLSSKSGFKGIAKKIAIFIIVAVGHSIDMALGDGSMVMTAIIMFYLGNELISIIENSGRMGLPVPDVLTKAVEIFKEQSTTSKK